MHETAEPTTELVAPGRILLTSDQVQQRVRELAAEITQAYAGRTPLLIGVLKGAFIVMSDIARHIRLPVEFDYMAVSSYGAVTHSSGVVRILKDLDAHIEGRDVLVIEDIVDSGLTLKYLLRTLGTRGPASLEVCAFMVKPLARRGDLPIRFVGFDIEDHFVVGYGLDYNEHYRHLPYVAVLDNVNK